MAIAPAPAPEQEPQPQDPQRNMRNNARTTLGGPTTPGVSFSGGSAVPLQSVQFGAVGGPANAQSHDNPINNATPNVAAAQGLTGVGIAR